MFGCAFLFQCLKSIEACGVIIVQVHNSNVCVKEISNFLQCHFTSPSVSIIQHDRQAVYVDISLDPEIILNNIELQVIMTTSLWFI